MRRKAHLPSKICAVCGLPFAWRRKWARDWEQVRYCSERCRRQRGATDPAPGVAPRATPAPAPSATPRTHRR